MVIDAVSFEKIYDEFAPKIFKFCYFRVSSREIAEDIASLVFVKTWDHLANGGNVANIQGFLYRVANNLIIDFYRKNKDRREISFDDPNNQLDIPDLPGFVDRIDQQMDVQEVHIALQQLPDHYREAMIMRYINDLSVKEIAEILEISENTVSVRLHRAIEKLKDVL